MATYDYLCKTHGEFEADHSIKEVLENCPMCKKEGKILKPSRLISKTSFILNGGRWGREGYS